jgi:hypothetical protein
MADIPFKVFKTQQPGTFDDPKDQFVFSVLPGFNTPQGSQVSSLEEFKSSASAANQQRALLDLNNAFGPQIGRTFSSIDEAFQGQSGFVSEGGELKTQKAIEQQQTLAADPTQKNIGTAEAPLFVPKDFQQPQQGFSTAAASRTPQPTPQAQPQLSNPNIATANPGATANKNFINALFTEGFGRDATQAELDKFASHTVKDASNIILGANRSPFFQQPVTPAITEPTEGVPSGSIGQQSPVLEAPVANDVSQSFQNSISSNLEQQKQQLTDAFDKQLADIERKQEEAQAQVDDFTEKQEGVLDQAKAAATPFRADLEKAERDRLKIDENFQANQSLINEMGTLLQQGNDLINQQKGTTGLAALRNPRINQTISDVSARAGVIQAVLSARNNQIGVAENMIDRTVAATNADRNDQLNYYNTLLNFYGNEKDVAGNKLINLDKDQKSFVAAKIGQLQDEVARTQETADFIKQAMISPETALDFANAGVTLNDSVETINAKLAEGQFKKEKSALINEMTTDGFTFLSTPAEVAGKPQSELFTVQDSRGNDMTFWRPPGSIDGGGLDPFTRQQIFTNTRSLKSDFDGRQEVKDFRQINSLIGRMRAAQEEAKTSDSLVAVDQALISSFNRITDPDSVVRESEYARTAGDLSLISQIKGKMDKLLTGGAGLIPEERAAIVRMSEAFVKVAEKNFSTIREEAIQTANEFGLDPRQIVGGDIGGGIESAGGGIPQASGPVTDLDVQGFFQNNPQFNDDMLKILDENENISNEDLIRIFSPESFSNDLGRSGKGSVDNIAQAIGQFESGGNYQAKSPVNPNGQRAYGKYQILAGNIPSWTKQALGKSLTVNQFLNNPRAQDRTALFQMSKIFDKHGTVEDVASVWFTGQPLAKAGGRKDVIGTTVENYVANIKSLLNKA